MSSSRDGANRRVTAKLYFSVFGGKIGCMEPVNQVIVKDPDVLGGTPVFRGRAFLSRPSWITWKADRLWRNSWMTFLP